MCQISPSKGTLFIQQAAEMKIQPSLVNLDYGAGGNYSQLKCGHHNFTQNQGKAYAGTQKLRKPTGGIYVSTTVLPSYTMARNYATPFKLVVLDAKYGITQHRK